MEFRKQIVEDFAIIFDGPSEEKSDRERITSDGDFADKWGWFGVMYRLTNGEIVNLGKITKLNLLECLTWLSYETDLQERKNVQLNKQNGSI